MTHLQQGSPAWDDAWAQIARIFGDTACECPETGEVWQYMGTWNGEHEFRHRNLPE